MKNSVVTMEARHEKQIEAVHDSYKKMNDWRSCQRVKRLFGELRWLCQRAVRTDFTRIMKSLTMSVYMPYRRSTASMMAHMKGMVMGGMPVGLGTRLRPSACAPELDYTPREPSRRYASKVNGAKGSYRSFCTRVRDFNSYVRASMSTSNTTRW